MFYRKLSSLLTVITLIVPWLPAAAEAQVEGCWPKRLPQSCTFVLANGDVGHSSQTLIVNGNNHRRNGTIEIHVDGNPESINAKVVIAKPEQFSTFCRFEYTQPVEQIQCKNFQVHRRFQGSARDLLFWGQCSNGNSQVCFTGNQPPSVDLIQQLQ